MRKTKYTKEFLEPLVKVSSSMSDVVRRATNSPKAHGSMVKYIGDKVRAYNLDTSHFSPNGFVKGNVPKLKLSRSEFENKYFIENSPAVASSRIKKHLVDYSIRRYECSVCNINTWQDKKLVLQLDHINGVSNDNRLSNLRLLCPNCHSQTPTFTGRNNIHRG